MNEGRKVFAMRMKVTGTRVVGKNPMTPDKVCYKIMLNNILSRKCDYTYLSELS